MIQAAPGQVAQGIVVDGLTDHDLARLNHYEGGFDYALRPCTVETEMGRVNAEYYVPDPTTLAPGAPWSLEDWAARCGDLTLEAAQEVMEAFDRLPPSWIGTRFPQIRSRAQARLNARTSAPATLRHKAAPDHIQVARIEPLYDRFFLARNFHLRHAQFDGGLSAEIQREVFVMADAVTVLPYDPRRDRVMLIEQIRLGPVARGDAQPWLLECIAGRIDGGETPEAAARREALEEGGIELRDLISLGGYYPSPGAVSEYLHGFIAVADLPEMDPALGGLDTEDEDIRIHVVPFATAMDLCASGEIQNGPLLLSLLQLSQRREALRAG